MQMIRVRKQWFLKWTAAMVAVVMMLGMIPHFSKIIVDAESQADIIVSVALGEEGYTEGSNNDNKYGAYFNQNNVAWCALFISWCARQAGIPTSIIKTTAWAGDMGSSQRTGNFGSQYYPKGSITPQKGDIVYYDWNKNGSSDHVEIVISVNESSKTFTSIGGNTKGDSGSTEGVRRHSNYSFTSSYIVGFERPNYNSSVTPPANDDELGIPYPRPQVSSTVWLGKNGITSGDYVKWLQTALNKADDAGLAVDGQFGSGTTAAVKNFQAKYGLTQDGQAGTATINKLVEVIKSQNSISLSIDIWLSNDKMGVETSKIETGNWYYLCYKIYDKNSSKLLSEVTSNYKDYSITEIIYNPDGSIFNSCTYNNSDNNWIGIKPSNAGTYKWKIILKVGDRESSTEKEFIVSESKPNLEAPNLNVDVNGQDVTLSWNLVENATHYDVRIYYKDGTSYEDYWGESETQNSLTVTLPANTEFKAQVCSANKYYENCWTYCQPVTFKTGANSYVITFDSNDGTCSTTNKTVTNGTTYGALPTPTRAGYDFNGWYTSKSGGTKITSDTIVSITENQTLYAHWSETFYIVMIYFFENDGTDNFSSMILDPYSTYYEPELNPREGYNFLGWYTEKEGGILVTTDTIYDLLADGALDMLCLYAHWEKIKIPGDLNSDSTLTTADAVLLQKHLLNQTTLTETQYNLADLNADGAVNGFDLALLRQKLLA